MLKPSSMMTMNKVFISPEAGRDLYQIRQYLSKELKNPGAARNTVNGIVKDIKSLGRFPKQGPSVEALTGFQTDLRILLCNKHIALYKIENDIVYISRIVDARQDYLRVLFGDDYLDVKSNPVPDAKEQVKLAESLFGIIREIEADENAIDERIETI